MLGRIALSGVPLQPQDLYDLASVVAKCQHLRILELINCHLDTGCLKSLADGIKGSDVKIDVLDVSFNRNLRKDSLPYLYEICLHTRGLNYWQCGFKQLDLLTFDPSGGKPETLELTREQLIESLYSEHAVFDCSRDAVQNHAAVMKRLLKTQQDKEIPITLRISGYECLDYGEQLKDLIQGCSSIYELEISNCSFNANDVDTIGKALFGKEIKTVNVFLSPHMNADAWTALGEIVRNSQANILLITACGLTGPKLEGLQLSLYPNQLTKLDVSRNEDMDEKCLETLGNLVENSNVKELIMAYCRLSATSMRALERSATKAKLSRFDLSGNTTMGCDGFAAVASIVENCSVEQLDMSECDPTGEHLKSFESSLDKAKLVKMNVSRNSNLSTEGGLEVMANIAKRTSMRELFMRQCDLDHNSLAAFKKTMGSEKIPRVDLGHYFMKDRPVTDEEIEVVVELLDNVSEELILNKWALSGTQKQRLKDALNSYQGEAPTIQLNRSVNNVMRKGDA